MAEPKAVADQSVRMSDVSKLARGDAAPERDDPFSRLGRTFAERLIDKAIGDVGGGAAPADRTDPVDQARKIIGLGKDVGDIEDRRLKRILEENEDLRRRLEARDKDGGGSLELMKFFADLQERAEKRNQDLIREMREEQRELRRQIDEARDRPKPDDELTGLVKKVGLESLMGGLQRDPVEEAIRLRKRHADLFGDVQQGQVVDLERWKAQKQFDIETKRIEAENAREERQAERDAKREERFTELFGALRGNPAPDAQASAITPGQQPMRRYICAACGKEFIDKAGLASVECQHCHAQLNVNPDPNAGAASAG